MKKVSQYAALALALVLALSLAACAQSAQQPEARA